MIALPASYGLYSSSGVFPPGRLAAYHLDTGNRLKDVHGNDLVGAGSSGTAYKYNGAALVSGGFLQSPINFPVGSPNGFWLGFWAIIRAPVTANTWYAAVGVGGVALLTRARNFNTNRDLGLWINGMHYGFDIDMGASISGYWVISSSNGIHVNVSLDGSFIWTNATITGAIISDGAVFMGSGGSGTGCTFDEMQLYGNPVGDGIVNPTGPFADYI